MSFSPCADFLWKLRSVFDRQDLPHLEKRKIRQGSLKPSLNSQVTQSSLFSHVMFMLVLIKFLFINVRHAALIA